MRMGTYLIHNLTTFNMPIKITALKRLQLISANFTSLIVLSHFSLFKGSKDYHTHTNLLLNNHLQQLMSSLFRFKLIRLISKSSCSAPERQFIPQFAL